MSDRPDWDTYWLSVAQAVSTRADCTRRRVGALLVSKDNRLLSTGYNGAPAGEPGCASDHACPRGLRSYEETPAGSPYDDCIAIHAEANAFTGVRRSDLDGATLYVTSTLCGQCERLVKAYGVRKVVTPDERREQ